MDHAFWQTRWEKGEIGFHSHNAQPALVHHWAKVGAERGSTVFVPLCGKSLDLLWLAEQGHRIIGSELSELAVDAFFAERGFEPSVRAHRDFKIKSAGVYDIWCGDFFALEASDFAAATAIYDRAALVAMPRDTQPRYAQKLAELAKPTSAMLLIGLDYNTQDMEGPPFAVPKTRIDDLFSADFSIEVVDVRDGLAKSEHLKKRGVTRLEEATYLLRRKT